MSSQSTALTLDVVQALHSYEPSVDGCLQFRRGDLLLVYNRDKSGWWDGVCHGKRGWFPSEYVTYAPEELTQKVIAELASLEQLTTEAILLSPTSLTLMTNSVANGSRDFKLDRAAVSSSSSATSVERSSRSPRNNLHIDTSRPTLPTITGGPVSSTGVQRSNSNEKVQTPSQQLFAPTSFPTTPLATEAETITFQSLIDQILHPISQLATAGTERKVKFSPLTNDVANAVRLLFAYCGILYEESPAVLSNTELREARKDIITAVNQLAFACRVALGVWPPSDAVNGMRRQALNVLQCVKRFVRMTEEIPLELNSAAVEAILDEQRKSGSSAESAFFSPLLSPVRSDDPMRMVDEIQEREFLRQLEEYQRAISRVGLEIQQALADDKQMSGYDDGMFSGIKEMVNKVGQMLSFLEDLGVPKLTGYEKEEFSSPNTMIQNFHSCRDILYDCLNELLNAFRSFFGGLPPAGFSELVSGLIEQVLNTVDRVVEAAQTVIGQKKLLDLQNLSARSAWKLDMPVSSSSGTNLLALRRKARSLQQLAARPVTPQVPTPRIPPVPTTPQPTIPSQRRTTLAAIMPSQGMHSVPPAIPSMLQQSQPLPVIPTRAMTRSVDTSNEEKADVFKIQDAPKGKNATATGVKFVAPESVKSDVDARPWFLRYDYDPKEVVMNVEGQVLGATFEALVERLTLHDVTITPENLTADQLQMWKQKKQIPTRLRVFNMLKNWLESYFFDGHDDEILERLTEFTENDMMKVFPSNANRLLELIINRRSQRTTVVSSIAKGSARIPRSRSSERLTSTNSSTNNADQPPPTPQLSRNLVTQLRAKNLQNLVDVDPLELARQLSLLDCRMYSAVRPYELVGQEFTKKDSKTAVNVKCMIVLSTQITTWVAEMIVLESDVKRRALLIKFFIKVAERCLLLNNFNSLFAILSALNSSTIERLRKTWALVSAKVKHSLEELSRITDHGRNFAEYRTRLKGVGPPCIPFFGLFLTDLVFTDEGNANYRRDDDSLINFDKWVKTVRIIQDMQRFQKPYNLVEVPELQLFLRERFNTLRTMGDPDQLYRLSLAAEPREEENRDVEVVEPVESLGSTPKKD